jgi:hypothetical protein
MFVGWWDSSIDGEIVCLDARGRSNFKSLLFRRDRPFLYAFDLLEVDGEDLRELPLIERKRRLRQLIPSVPTRLLYIDHVSATGKTSSNRLRARSRGNRGKAGERTVSLGRERTQLGEDQESCLHSDDRSLRTLRAPNRFAQAPSDGCASGERSGRPEPQRDVCPQYLSIQPTTSLIIAFRGIACPVS